MLRAAAKNHGTPEGGVTVVIDPSDYARILADIDGPQRQPSYGLRLALATKAYAHSGAYACAIAPYLTSLAVAEPEPDKEHPLDPCPLDLHLQVRQQQVSRYSSEERRIGQDCERTRYYCLS